MYYIFTSAFISNKDKKTTTLQYLRITNHTNNNVIITVRQFYSTGYCKIYKTILK